MILTFSSWSSPWPGELAATSRSAFRRPIQYVIHALAMVTVNPIVRSLIPAIQLFGITKPYPMTTVGKTNPISGYM